MTRRAAIFLGMAMLASCLGAPAASARQRSRRYHRYENRGERAEARRQEEARRQDPPAAAPAASESAPQNYIDQREFGVGLAWMSLPVGSLSTFNNQSGYVSGRYWFGRHFGLEGGMGLGFPAVTSPAQFLLNFNLEPLFAMATRRHSVLYSDMALTPSILTGGKGVGTSTALDISYGFGLEHAMAEFPRFAWYGQWNPLSFNIYMPDAGSTQLGIGFLGSVMNFNTGFHYYF